MKNKQNNPELIAFLENIKWEEPKYKPSLKHHKMTYREKELAEWASNAHKLLRLEAIIKGNHGN